jgi:hypothetical protein
MELEDAMEADEVVEVTPAEPEIEDEIAMEEDSYNDFEMDMPDEDELS